MNIDQLECLRCGKKWYPRIIDGKTKIPSTCPDKSCRSPYWQTLKNSDSYKNCVTCNRVFIVLSPTHKNCCNSCSIKYTIQYNKRPESKKRHKENMKKYKSKPGIQEKYNQYSRESRKRKNKKQENI